MHPTTQFSKSSRALSGLQTYCKPCMVDLARLSRLANPERRELIERTSRAKYADFNQFRTIQRRAQAKGVPVCSREQFETWRSTQTCACAYCGDTEERVLTLYGHRLHVDRLRALEGYVPANMALACQRCNMVKSAYLTHEQMLEVASRFFAKAEGK